MARHKVGPGPDPAVWYDPVVVINPETGEPASAGGGAGTSDTTEATQLLVKTAVETLAAAPPLTAAQLTTAALATEAKQDDIVTAISGIGAGDASAANQTTIIGHVDGIEGKLDTLITSSAATQTASESTATVNVAQVTDVIKLGATDLTPKFAVINLSASGDLLALVASKRIRIVSMLVMAAADVTLTLRSGGSTAISGVLPLLAKSGFVLPYNPVGWFQTASGEKLDAVLGGSVDVDGFFTYIEV